MTVEGGKKKEENLSGILGAVEGKSVEEGGEGVIKNVHVICVCGPSGLLAVKIQSLIIH